MYKSIDPLKWMNEYYSYQYQIFFPSFGANQKERILFPINTTLADKANMEMTLLSHGRERILFPISTTHVDKAAT